MAANPRPAGPDLVPGPLPPKNDPDVAGGRQAEIERVEEESVQEHPEGSAPPLDRVTQDRDPSDLDPVRER